ncbi:MAG: hypothetical protein FJY29_10700 [Betaproteobacteria bacterium]|nr:hypothetical protein [Betaproteobacteria bacterium]
MYSSDKGLTTDKARASLPRSSPLRRRLTSRLQPLHGGLGFGAGAIRERALVVARQSSQRGSLQPGRPHLGSSGQGLQFTEEQTVVRELEQIPFLLDEETAKPNDARLQALNNQVRRVSAQQSTLQRTASGLQVPEAAQVPSIKSFIAASKRNAAPSLFQGLTAWFFDALVVVACLVLAFTVSASVPFLTLLSQKFPVLAQYGAFESAHSSPLGWLLLMGQTFAVGSMLLFAVQAFSGFFLAASVGRAIADVRLATYRSPLGRAFKIGLGEMLQWPLAFGLLNTIVSPEHNFLVRSLKWARGTPQN